MILFYYSASSFTTTIKKLQSRKIQMYLWQHEIKQYIYCSYLFRWSNRYVFSIVENFPWCTHLGVATVPKFYNVKTINYTCFHKTKLNRWISCYKLSRSIDVRAISKACWNTERHVYIIYAIKNKLHPGGNRHATFAKGGKVAYTVNTIRNLFCGLFPAINLL